MSKCMTEVFLVQPEEPQRRPGTPPQPRVTPLIGPRGSDAVWSFLGFSTLRNSHPPILTAPYPRQQPPPQRALSLAVPPTTSIRSIAQTRPHIRAPS